MIELTEKLNFDFNYLLKKYEYPDYSKYKNQDILFHNTWIENIDEITKNGIKVDKSKQLEYSGNMIWCVNFSGATGYGGCTVAFRNDFDYDECEQLNSTEFAIYRDVPASDILFIDTWISDRSDLKRVSDVRGLVHRLGVDRVRNTLVKARDKGAIFFYDIDYLISRASQ